MDKNLKYIALGLFLFYKIKQARENNPPETLPAEREQEKNLLRLNK
jgi:hypothetical protein